MPLYSRMTESYISNLEISILNLFGRKVTEEEDAFEEEYDQIMKDYFEAYEAYFEIFLETDPEVVTYDPESVMGEEIQEYVKSHLNDASVQYYLNRNK